MPALLPSTSRAHLFNVAHLKVAAGACSVKGLEHESNEDREYISPQHDLFIVAHGVGAHAAGEAASQFTVDTLNHELGRIQDEPHTAAEVKQLVRTALEDAHCLILEMGDLIPAYHDGDADVVLALLFGERLFIAGAGDSRAYLYRNKAMEELTHDNAPILTRSEPAGDHQPTRSQLLSELGMSDFRLKQRIRVLEVRPGDRFLLCTESLMDAVDTGAIQRVLATQGNPRRAAHDLVQAAVERGATDNVTGLVFDVSDVSQERPASAEGLLARWKRFFGRAWKGMLAGNG